MIRKELVLPDFPDPETIRQLSGYKEENEDFSPVFYDIETTGLSRDTSFLYLTGAVSFENGVWKMRQWMASGKEEERILLKESADFLRSFSLQIQYNGDGFDQPYLEARLRQHKLDSPFPGTASLDLYRRLKPLKGLLGLPGMKQPQLEHFLGLLPRRYCDGGECVRLYRKYVKKPEEAAARELLGHNQEDLAGLGRVFLMLGYLCLFQGDYQILKTELNGQELFLTLQAGQSLPTGFATETEDFCISGSDRNIFLRIRAREGRIRQYYPNYREYDYLPGEDTAIPKSLSRYMDRSLRRPATVKTCYTWFDCRGRFLEDPAMQKSYLLQTLPILLSQLPVK